MYVHRRRHARPLDFRYRPSCVVIRLVIIVLHVIIVISLCECVETFLSFCACTTYVVLSTLSIHLCIYQSIYLSIHFGQIELAVRKPPAISISLSLSLSLSPSPSLSLQYPYLSLDLFPTSHSQPSYLILSTDLSLLVRLRDSERVRVRITIVLA